MDKPNKWKVPEWMKPGVKARIVRGRKHPVGTACTIVSTHVGGTGGAYAFVHPEGAQPIQGYDGKDHPVQWRVWVTNLSPA